ncbi:MAG: flagellar hook protein FlgE [Candidatus Hydrogenedentes bacterium]|nr:flagellar hook protein FlgE [Candidatus Hydrogenedentota bacterium]
MGTAIFTGVTGLLTHQRRLDAVASNIANVNTTGYRGSRVLFQDLFSQTLEGARAPVGSSGGSNPSQIGLGVRLGSIDVNHNQGSLFTTGVNSDLAIQGSGFFVLSDGLGTSFTRDGSFALNANGELIDPATGLRVQGFLADRAGNISANTPLTNIVIPVGGTAIVQATETMTLIGNLDSDAAVGTTLQRNITAFDSLGTARDIQLVFTKTATTNEWSWAATFVNVDNVSNSVGSGTLTFDASGALGSQTGDTGVTITNAQLGSIVALPEDPFAFTLDFSAITQLSSDSDVAVSNQDGFPRGVLESFNIGRDGLINGVFTNGLTRVIGQVAVAIFANVGGLARFGSNLFRDTPASGNAQIGFPNAGGRGQVSGGVLEGSNVDLGTEFSNLIITQRGFQANARTITTADTLLQEAVNLVR